MLRTASIVVAVGILVAAGVVEGVRANRWGVAGEVQAAADRLAAVPVAFGDWTGTDDPIDRKVLERAEAVGVVSRVYRNRRTGARVNTLLLCGPAGPIGSHTPDICYAGLGYTMPRPEVRKTVALPGGAVASYWSGRFVKDPADLGLEVCWAWGVDGDWVAAEHARGEFFYRKALYKLYVTRVLPAGWDGTPGPDPVQEFLTEFLPETKTALAPNPS